MFRQRESKLPQIAMTLSCVLLIYVLFIDWKISKVEDEIDWPPPELSYYGPNTLLETNEKDMIEDLEKYISDGGDPSDILYITDCNYDGVYMEQVGSNSCLHRLQKKSLPDFMLYEYDHNNAGGRPMPP